MLVVEVEAVLVAVVVELVVLLEVEALLEDVVLLVVVEVLVVLLDVVLVDDVLLLVVEELTRCWNWKW